MLLFSHDSRSLLISFDLLASAGGIKSSSVCVRNVAFEATSTSFQFQAQVIGLNQIHCFHIHFRLPLKIFGLDLGCSKERNYFSSLAPMGPSPPAVCQKRQTTAAIEVWHSSIEINKPNTAKLLELPMCWLCVCI